MDFVSWKCSCNTTMGKDMALGMLAKLKKMKYLLYVHVEAIGVPCCLGSIYKIFPYVSCTIFFKKNSDRFDEIVYKI